MDEKNRIASGACLAALLLVGCSVSENALTVGDAAPLEASASGGTGGIVGSPEVGPAPADAAGVVSADGPADTAANQGDVASAAADASMDIAADTSPAAPPDAGPPQPACGVRQGTTATASGSYMSSPADAFDGDPKTAWNSGEHTGSIHLKFSRPQLIQAVVLSAQALPATGETYTIFGYRNGAAVRIGGGVRQVGLSPGGPLEAIPVSPVDSYEELRIDVGQSASWIAINEIAFAYLPPGTTATASGTYQSAAGDALDGNVVSGWNSGAHTGWLHLKFPAPQRLDALHLHAASLPDTQETYTVLGFTAGAPQNIATTTRTVNVGAGRVLPVIALKEGTYDALQIQVGDSLSWILIQEIWLGSANQACRAP
jgi:hypothetical protein